MLLVVCALVRYLALTSALNPLQPVPGKRRARLQRHGHAELLRASRRFWPRRCFMHLAMTVTPDRATGVGRAMSACFGIAAGGGLIALGLGHRRIESEAA